MNFVFWRGARLFDDTIWKNFKDTGWIRVHGLTRPCQSFSRSDSPVIAREISPFVLRRSPRNSRRSIDHPEYSPPRGGLKKTRPKSENVYRVTFSPGQISVPVSPCYNAVLVRNRTRSTGSSTPFFTSLLDFSRQSFHPESIDPYELVEQSVTARKRKKRLAKLREKTGQSERVFRGNYSFVEESNNSGMSLITVDWLSDCETLAAGYWYILRPPSLLFQYSPPRRDIGRNYHCFLIKVLEDCLEVWLIVWFPDEEKILVERILESLLIFNLPLRLIVWFLNWEKSPIDRWNGREIFDLKIRVAREKSSIKFRFLLIFDLLIRLIVWFSN